MLYYLRVVDFYLKINDLVFNFDLFTFVNILFIIFIVVFLVSFEFLLGGYMSRNSYFDLLKKLDRIYNKTSLDTIDFSIMPRDDFEYAKRVVNKLINFTVKIGDYSSKTAKVICSNWWCSLDELQSLMQVRTGKSRSISSIKVLRSRLSSQLFSIFGHDFVDWFTVYNLNLSGIRQVDTKVTALLFDSGGAFIGYLSPKLREVIILPPKNNYTNEELKTELSFVKTISSVSFETLSNQCSIDIDKLRYIYRVLSTNLLSTTSECTIDLSSAIDLRYALVKAPTLLMLNKNTVEDATENVKGITENAIDENTIEDATENVKDYLGIEPLSESDIVDLLKASMGYDFGSQERMNQPNNDEAVNKFVNTLGLILSPQGIVSVLNRTHPDVIRKGIDIMRKTIESAKRNE